MNWRTDKPTEKVIVAKLTEDFCHIKDNYSLLYLTDKPYQHYCEHGEEIPYSAIEKWASLEEDKRPEGLEKAAEEYACQGIPDGMKSAFKPLSDEIAKHFIAGAEWMKAKMMENAFRCEIIKSRTHMPHLKPYFFSSDYGKIGDKVRVFVIPEEK